MLLCPHRLKDLSFKERSFTLELPKPLILADILVSVLYPPFDNLTLLARYKEKIRGINFDDAIRINLTFFQQSHATKNDRLRQYS